jgi:hypothetical protein
MKIAALITVAALTCGTAFAQSSSTTTDSSATRKHAATASDTQPKGEGFMDKTKRAFHKLGEKLHAGKKSDDTTDKTAQQSPDTRSMGASASDKGARSDSSRQSRMDEAYANSKKSKSMDK